MLLFTLVWRVVLSCPPCSMMREEVARSTCTADSREAVQVWMVWTVLQGRVTRQSRDLSCMVIWPGLPSWVLIDIDIDLILTDIDRFIIPCRGAKSIY